MKYLYLDRHNGHSKSYHPFTVDILLTQEAVTSRLSKILGAERMGTCLEQLLEILYQEGHNVDYWTCDCCGSVVRIIEEPNLKDWTVLEGISGNY